VVVVVVVVKLLMRLEGPALDMTPMEPKELANDGGSEEMCDRDSSSIRAVAAELLTSVEFGFLPDTASG
jgi:hypothetical protein